MLINTFRFGGVKLLEVSSEINTLLRVWWSSALTHIKFILDSRAHQSHPFMKRVTSRQLGSLQSVDVAVCDPSYRFNIWSNFHSQGQVQMAPNYMTTFNLFTRQMSEVTSAAWQEIKDLMTAWRTNVIVLKPANSESAADQRIPCSCNSHEYMRRKITGAYCRMHVVFSTRLSAPKKDPTVWSLLL